MFLLNYRMHYLSYFPRRRFVIWFSILYNSFLCRVLINFEVIVLNKPSIGKSWQHGEELGVNLMHSQLHIWKPPAEIWHLNKQIEGLPPPPIPVGTIYLHTKFGTVVHSADCRSGKTLQHSCCYVKSSMRVEQVTG